MRRLNHLEKIAFQTAQPLFAQRLQIFTGYKTAFSGNGDDKTFTLQLLIGTLGGNQADAQLPGQKPKRGQRVPRLQSARENLAFDLAGDLDVYKRQVLC